MAGEETSVPIVDAHFHLVDLEQFHYYWMQPWMTPLQRSFLADDFRSAAETVNVRRGVLVQAHPSVEESIHLAELAEKHEEIAGIVAWVDLREGGIEDTLRRYAGFPAIKAVRDQQAEDRDPDWWLDDRTITGLQSVSRAGFRYDLLMRVPQLRVVPNLLDRLPEMRWILEHAGKPPISSGELKRWRNDLRAIAQSPNVACKISGLVVEADHERWKTDDLRPFVQSAAELFGTDRLMWGSDWPVSLLAAKYKRTLDSAVHALGTTDTRELSRFLEGSARSWYELG